MNIVTPLGNPERHFWMTRSVARALGVSLGEAMATGKLTQKDYADLVTRCRQCCFVDTCETWLANNSLDATTAPDFCQHADLFEALKPGP